MCFKNRWTISSSYDLQAHQQHSQRRCCFSLTALLWFEVLPDLWSAHPDLWPVHPDLSPAHPYLSPAHPGLPPVHLDVPRLVVSALRLVAGTPSYSEGQQEFPPRVRYSPEIDVSKFTLHILSDTPRRLQWQKFILLMWQLVADIHKSCISHRELQKQQLHASCPILTMSIKGASTIFCLVHWVIKASRGYMRS